MPKDPMFILDTLFDGGVLVNKEDVIAAAIAAALVARCRCSSRKLPPAVRCARWPTTTRPAQSIGIPLPRWVDRLDVAGVVAPWWQDDLGQPNWGCSSR